MFSLKRIILIYIGCISFNFSGAHGQEQPVQNPDFNPRLFIAELQPDGTTQFEYEWRRPEGVDFVLISACGGGGGGSAGVAIGQEVKTPYGGFAGDWTTMVLPVMSELYSITIGEAGPGDPQTRSLGQQGMGDGRPTIFKDITSDFEAVFLGGKAGKFGNASIGSPAGGQRSIFGEGGTSAPGNAGGSPKKSVHCAGGGGGAIGFKGGDGNPGALILYPLPDVQRFSNVLTALENLNSQATPGE